MRIAIAQMEPVHGDIEKNRGTIERLMAVAAEGGARVVVFPECALQGYIYSSFTEAVEIAVTRDHHAITSLREKAHQLDLVAAVGFVERLDGGYANSVVVLRDDCAGPVHRKTHLPVAGLDRWARAGDAFGPMFEVDGARLGILICYELRYPEASRVLTLQGMDALLVPTNWPVGFEAAADHAVRTRAWENRVWLAAANRVGVERGTRFIGRSLLADPTGAVVAECDQEEEGVKVHEIDIGRARDKTLPGQEGERFDFLAHRRPALYGRVCGEGVADG